MRHINEICNVYICLFNIKGHMLSFIKHMYVTQFYCCVYMSFKKNSCVYMSYTKNLCVHMSFNIKRHIYTSVISWWLPHSSSSHPSSTRSSISFLYFSSFFGRGGGRDVITSYHHCRVRGMFPAILIFLINNFSMEGNSVAASSSSLRMARFISLISSRNVSIEVREVRVSSVLEFSLHCSFPPVSY